jgi:transcriptional regulator with XRE-family HTH domain
MEVERTRNMLSRNEVAQRLGVTGSTYTKWINGQAVPSDKLEKLAELYGVSCDYLLGRTEMRETARYVVCR